MVYCQKELENLNSIIKLLNVIDCLLRSNNMVIHSNMNDMKIAAMKWNNTFKRIRITSESNGI